MTAKGALPLRADRVVYTAVFGGYDSVRPVRPCDGCDFVCFTDNPVTVARGWQLRLVSDADEPPALLNRKIKMLAHRYLADYSQSLYIDGHVSLRRCPAVLFDKYLGHAEIAIPAHLDRRCAYEEAAYCVAEGIIPAEITAQQMASYASQGFPRRSGLSENGVILRRHLEPRIVDLMEAWWLEYLHKARRDQLSLPFLAWQRQIAITPLEEGPRLSSRYFTLHPHRKQVTAGLHGVAWWLRAFKHRSPLHRGAHALYDVARRVLNAR